MKKQKKIYIIIIGILIECFLTCFLMKVSCSFQISGLQNDTLEVWLCSNSNFDENKKCLFNTVEMCWNEIEIESINPSYDTLKISFGEDSGDWFISNFELCSFLLKSNISCPELYEHICCPVPAACTKNEDKIILRPHGIIHIWI